MRFLEVLLGVLVVAAALFRPGRVSRLPAGGDAEDLAAGYERSDARVGWIVAGLAALVLALAVVLVVVTTFEAGVTGLPVTVSRPSDLVNRLTPAPTPPAPRLEIAEGEQLATYRAAVEQRMNAYEWVDRASGSVRVPVERAMDLVAERGLPTRPADSARDDGTASPSSASSGRVDERVWP